MELEMGPWAILTLKGNATLLQRKLVPWFIALYGISYSKVIELYVVKEMLIAVCDSLNILEDSMSCEEAAKAYPIGFADIAKRVKAAAGMYLYIPFL
jgi:hypothetical protein